ncbi:hypothetical protein ACFL14_02160 [Patescibacteria group bacterium]
MSKIVVYPTSEELMEVFFEGNLLGWPTGKTPEQTSPALPGWKIIPVPVGNFIFYDRYTVGANRKSFGFMEIRDRKDPINLLYWRMEFGGWYSEDAIKVVKAALLEAYATKRFFGGRGIPFYIPAGDIMYENRIDNGGDFSKFSGREEVVDRQALESKGFHCYRGGLMFDPQ